MAPVAKTANGRGRSHLGLILAALVGIGAFSWIGPTYGPRLVDWIAGSSPKRPTAPPPLTLTAAHDRGILSDG